MGKSATKKVEPQPEKMLFQTEVKELLHLMIHALYSNKEIALRELISNASDAADKLRFEALADDSLYEQDSHLTIRISLDEKARTLTISDNGIGMTKDEVIANIGTIARSGTKEFISNLSQESAKDANFIGQFGVGFYSAFIIADTVTVITRRAGTTQATKWSSHGESDYTLEATEKSQRGTDVILHLRDTEDEFLNDWRVKSIIRKYSDHIVFPILMKKTEWKDGNTIISDEDEVVNKASALWVRNKNDIEEHEYQSFYQQITHDNDAPMLWSHTRVEGKHEYIALLYIPSHAPFDLYDREHKQGIKLYVRRVFIMEDSEKMLPRYLRFVRGVIDSASLPLNVSREILQSSRDLDAIKQGISKRVLGMLEDLVQNKPDTYHAFWDTFGRVLKEGVAEDFSHKDKIAELLRFSSTHNDEQRVSFKDYIGRMKDGQEAIYYITADSLSAAKNSPHLEIFRKKDVEVLLLVDRIDEWMINALPEVDGKKLRSVAKGDLDLGKLTDADEQKVQDEIEKTAGDIIPRLKEILSEHIKDVRITHRLTDSPACLVVEEHELSGNLARLLKSVGQKTPESKPILEVNLQHRLLLRLKLETDQERFNELARVLFDQALLAEGGQLDDPATFVKRINKLIV